MAPDCENPQWEYYDRHRKATKAQWNSLLWHRKTAEGKPSQYNPYEYGSNALVEELELYVWKNGNLIEPRGAKYLDIGKIVGVCSGDETTYAFAECASGFVHGRPISVKALQKLGVNI